MKTHLLWPLLLIFTFPSLSALDTVFLEPVQPVSTVLKGQGGASTGNASGYDALFVNPASFADPTTSLTFLDTESTLHLPLSAINDVLNERDSWNNFNLLDSTNPMAKLINRVVTKSGFGQEFSVGSGWVGNKLGLGFITQSRLTAKGTNLLKAQAKFDTTLMGVIGMGWPFEVGMGTLNLGGSIRPMQRSFSSFSALDLLTGLGSQSYNAFPLYSGFGLGIDLGLRWDYAGFKTGLAVRDAGGTVFNFKEFTIAQWLERPGFPSGGGTDGNTIYRIPTVVALGTSWTPEMGALSSLFQPSVSADLQIPIKNENTQSSFWTWTHIGAQFLLLKAVAIRTGFNQGYLTFGLGAKLFFVDLNLAIFSDELGRYSGYDRRSGVSLDLAFRL